MHSNLTVDIDSIDIVREIEREDSLAIVRCVDRTSLLFVILIKYVSTIILVSSKLKYVNIILYSDLSYKS
jgi:hypothetical protein